MDTAAVYLYGFALASGFRLAAFPHSTRQARLAIPLIESTRTRIRHRHCRGGRPPCVSRHLRPTAWLTNAFDGPSDMDIARHCLAENTREPFFNPQQISNQS
jgi:hypothetical protein